MIQDQDDEAGETESAAQGVEVENEVTEDACGFANKLQSTHPLSKNVKRFVQNKMKQRNYRSTVIFTTNFIRKREREKK